MNSNPTYVLIYAMLSFQGCMPCIFVSYVVTRTSMQTRDDNVADFRNLVFSLSPISLITLLHAHRITSSHPRLCFGRVAYQIVRLEE